MNANQTSPGRSKISTPRKGIAYALMGVLFLGVGVILFAARLLPGQPSSTHEMVKLCLAMAVIVSIFAISIWEVYDAATTRALKAPFMILLLTVASLFAFGWEEVNGLLLPNIKELLAIFVLFALSELTLHLTKRIELTEEKTESVADAIATLSQKIYDVKNALERSDLVESVRKMSGLAKSFEQLFTIEHAGAWQHVFNEVTVKYTGVWSSEARRILASRSDDEVGREAVLVCWKALLSTYVDEERHDILSIPPQIATNQKMYLALLESLAKSVSQPGTVFRQSDRIPVLLGISNVLPESWFNWQREIEPPEAYQYDPIDNYRNLVTRVVSDAKKDGALEYHRLLLVDGDDRVLKEQGIRSMQNLKEQANLLILTHVGSVGATPFRKEIVERFKTSFPNWRVFQYNPRAETCYFIVSHDELLETAQYLRNGQQLKSLEDSKGGYEIEIHNGWRQKLRVERLAVKFLNELHTSVDYANVAETNLSAQEDLGLLQKDHDLLMVGYKESKAATVQWQMALTTNLQPGIETMLLHVIYDRDELTKLDKWQAGGSGINVQPFATAVGLKPGEY